MMANQFNEATLSDADLNKVTGGTRAPKEVSTTGPKVKLQAGEWGELNEIRPSKN